MTKIHRSGEILALQSAVTTDAAYKEVAISGPKVLLVIAKNTNTW